MAAAYRKSLDLAKVQIKHCIGISALLALLMTAATPILFGINDLDSMASSFILERYVALIGIILFTPLFSPEGDKNVQELIESKYTSPTLVLMIRLCLSSIVVLALIGGCIALMQVNHCLFQVPQFIFGTVASALFLGSLGFLAHSISNNIVVGYMLPVFFYILNQFLGEKLKLLYLFSLVRDSIHEKYFLFAGAILLFGLGLLFRYGLRRIR